MRAAHLAFGRFAGGRPIALQAASYVYIGSAMGNAGASSLASRLLRHAARCNGRPPHALRALLLKHFIEHGLCGPTQSKRIPSKTLHWNVDYLLDHPSACLRAAYLLYADAPLERALSALLADDPHCVAFARGLGAGDAPGQTHLLRVDATASWWNALPSRLCTAYYP